MVAVITSGLLKVNVNEIKAGNFAAPNVGL
jgi:hypothetical protein